MAFLAEVGAEKNAEEQTKTRWALALPPTKPAPPEREANTPTQSPAKPGLNLSPAPIGSTWAAAGRAVGIVIILLWC